MKPALTAYLTVVGHGCGRWRFRRKIGYYCNTAIANRIQHLTRCGSRIESDPVEAVRLMLLGHIIYWQIAL